MDSERADTSERIRQIATRLKPLYASAVRKRGLNALDELIFTVLTQNTSDLNAERAYKALRAAMPTWEAVMNADPDDIAAAIKHGGLSNIKSARIKRVLRQIYAERGALDLEWLADLSLDAARDWLMRLDGVGMKTASVVASFALNLPAMPVDTHIHRVAKRLGLIGARIGAAEAHHLLEAQIEPQARFEFHMLLITHGRQLCRARRPLCAECPLNEICPSAET